MTNFDLCEKMYTVLKKLNVQTVVICAGARNAALVQHLSNQTFNKIYFFEERSAAFFALGIMQQTGKPVAVITTSGTAAAELLPATIEAFYQGLPLVLITADRPKYYRGTGSPQSIHQVGLFSHYVEHCFDWDCDEKNISVLTALQSPLHFNLCFDEPLMDLASSQLLPVCVEATKAKYYPVATAKHCSEIKNPLLIIGQLPIDKKDEIIELILNLQAPVYLEALSQLQGEHSIESLVLNSTDVLIEKIFQAGICESVVRIGGVPTVRFWRDLESQFKSTPVFNFTDLLFTGLARSTTNFRMDFEALNKIQKNKSWSEIKIKNQKLISLKKSLFQKFPNAEQTYVFRFSEFACNDPLYLGNSLPIREWDLFSDQQRARTKSHTISANRGANGIDGQISTYLGWSEKFARSWCLVGDLTAMYDLAALGLISKQSPTEKRVVIMNNFGGQIFKRVFKEPQFLNSHQIEFQNWAEMWKWDYLKVASASEFKNIQNLKAKNAIIELQPDLEQTADFWKVWDFACKEI